MACKGYMPIKNEFVFQDELYRTKHRDLNPDPKYWNLLYWNEENKKSIHFHFEDEELIYVELSPLDNEDSFFLYESTWTPEQIKKAHYNFGFL